MTNNKKSNIVDQLKDYIENNPEEAKEAWDKIQGNEGPTVKEYLDFVKSSKEQYTRVLRFYKDEGGWFVDLPEWEGGKAALAMVAGADDMLEFMSENKGDVFLRVSLYPYIFPEFNWDILTLLNADSYEGESGGGTYILETYNGETVNFKMWLCSVTRFVFGCLPHQIFIHHETGNSESS